MKFSIFLRTTSIILYYNSLSEKKAIINWNKILIKAIFQLFTFFPAGSGKFEWDNRFKCEFLTIFFPLYNFTLFFSLNCWYPKIIKRKLYQFLFYYINLQIGNCLIFLSFLQVVKFINWICWPAIFFDELLN
jgi:hypothetical protein